MTNSIICWLRIRCGISVWRIRRIRSIDFFETFFVLQEPTYSSTYPVGQGLGAGARLDDFRHALGGGDLPVAALCALCYWMLRGWTTPGWALAGGLLAVMEFGPLNQWMNSLLGRGATGGGRLPGLRRAAQIAARRGVRDAVLLGAGLAIHLLTRPYESIFLVLCVALYLLPAWRPAAKPLLVAALVVLPAIALTLLQNKQVTGSWTTPPYVLGQYQYGVPAVLNVSGGSGAAPRTDPRTGVGLQDAACRFAAIVRRLLEAICSAWYTVSVTIASSLCRRSIWRSHLLSPLCAIGGLCG
jgi:hypothetical protein